jgi:hypothetical protein
LRSCLRYSSQSVGRYPGNDVELIDYIQKLIETSDYSSN